MVDSTETHMQICCISAYLHSFRDNPLAKQLITKTPPGAKVLRASARACCMAKKRRRMPPLRVTPIFPKPLEIKGTCASEAPLDASELRQNIC